MNNTIKYILLKFIEVGVIFLISWLIISGIQNNTQEEQNDDVEDTASILKQVDKNELFQYLEEERDVHIADFEEFGLNNVSAFELTGTGIRDFVQLAYYVGYQDFLDGKEYAPEKVIETIESYEANEIMPDYDITYEDLFIDNYDLGYGDAKFEIEN